MTEFLLADTVLNEWFKPMATALEKVRFSEKKFRALPIPTFILTGCLRQLQDTPTLRGQIQELFHLDESASELPVARSTWSDALASTERRNILRSAVEQLVRVARDQLPDALAGVPGIGKRSVLAMDATYQEESCHYNRVLPKEGGDDNQKGHMLLTYFDLRSNIPVWVRTETASLGEMRVLKQAGTETQDWSRVKNAIYVVDRAFIDGGYWDERKQKLNSTVMTRLKAGLVYEVHGERQVQKTIWNENVLSDKKITLKCSKQEWRLIEWLSPEGIIYEYITNDFTLEPGVVAFLYHRRWAEEKYFDNFKNDLCNARAWGKSLVGIEQQALLGLVACTLTSLFLKDIQADLGLTEGNTTQQRKHTIKRDAYMFDGIGVACRAFYTVLSKIPRQVWRFLKNCFMKKSSPALYERQLKPMLEKYL
jgi:hypothetical protein